MSVPRSPWLLLALVAPVPARAGGDADRYGPEAKVCPASDLAKLEPPTGYVYVAGTDDSRSKAWSKVKEEAVARFAPNSGLSRKEKVGREVHPWCIRTDPGAFFQKEYTYLALVPRDVADAHEIELRGLDEQWSQLVASLAENVGGESLFVAPVVWDSGCASDLGDYVKATLLYQAGTRGLPALLTTQASAATATLRLQLILAAGVVTVVPTLEGGAGSRVLPGLKFAADLFHLDESTPQDWCPTNERIALDTDRRDGRDGLRVRIDSPVSGGVACAGDRGPLAVTTNRPAALRIYSLDREGKGYVVYDTPFVNGRAELGMVDLIPTDDGGDERVVAVAYPAGSAPAPTGGICRLPKPFSEIVFPEGIAIDTSTWIVHPPGVEGCPEFDVAAVRGRLPETVCR